MIPETIYENYFACPAYYASPVKALEKNLNMKRPSLFVYNLRNSQLASLFSLYLAKWELRWFKNEHFMFL
jgi:hypothetical protein